ncbi:hypothetical protein GGD54_003603 [Rhizobium tropici]|uniref:GNAT family N-acetyltransferase n=1 Tax=Rhizobium tropici TaxID=398 RepID=A0ABR6R1W0_RHITR|nr:hypothetical protein [Rhizobium tropici]MBB5594731.1 hypothetical protein [Rhizobium tropici]MBB6493179.1 hypothetical protein [Rhizobium tropici]
MSLVLRKAGAADLECLLLPDALRRSAYHEFHSFCAQSYVRAVIEA